MTYADMFSKVKSMLVDADVSDINEHLAYQFNVTGEAEGIFYANGIKANVLFFDKGTPTENIWIYDYRTGIKHTLVQNPLKRSDLDDFMALYCSGHMEDRQETYSKDNPNGRWRKYSIDEIRKRDGLNLDLSWMDLAEKDNRTIHEILSEMDEERNSINKAMDTLKELLAEVNL